MEELGVFGEEGLLFQFRAFLSLHWRWMMMKSNGESDLGWTLCELDKESTSQSLFTLHLNDCEFLRI